MKHRGRKKTKGHSRTRKRTKSAHDKKLHQFGYLFTHRYYVSE